MQIGQQPHMLIPRENKTLKNFLKNKSHAVCPMFPAVDADMRKFMWHFKSSSLTVHWVNTETFCEINWRIFMKVKKVFP